MRDVVGPEMGIKASGGVKSLRRCGEDGLCWSDPHRGQRRREDRQGEKQKTGTPLSVAA